MMIDKIISDFLKEKGGRIIIPGFGAFIVRDNGQTAFIEFLKTDDGVFAGQIRSELGVTAEEAASIVSEYSASLRSRLDENGYAGIEGLGVIRKNAEGKYDLNTDAEAAVVKPEEPLVQQEAVEPERTAAARQEAPEIKPEPVAEQIRPAETEQPQPAQTRQAATRESAAASRPARPEEEYKPQINIRRPKKRKKVDGIMIIAIIAIMITLCVILYGYFTEKGYVDQGIYLEEFMPEVLDTEMIEE